MRRAVSATYGGALRREARRILTIAAIAGALALRAGAQTPFPTDDFFKPLPQKAPWLLDWGSTLSFAGLYEYQGEETVSVAGGSGNLWLRFSLPGSWQYYGRVRDSLLVTLLPWPADGVELTNTWEIDANYLQLILPEGGITLSLGRKLFLLGSGFLLSGNGDGIELQMANPWFSAQAFGFYTGLLDPAFSSYGMSDADAEDGAERYFGGYSLGIAIFGHELSALGMYQSDFKMGSDDLYTSWYSGLQAKGLFLGGDYLFEWYLQGGYSPSGAESGEIEAFGGTVRYQRSFKLPTSPRFTLQYSLASGDDDRTAGTGAAGNASGTDTAFQAFGQLNLGSAYRPSFSNLHAAQVAVAINPFRFLPGRLSNTSVTLRYFYYAKHEADGVVNSGEADGSSADLGHAVDLAFRWAPFNDLSVFATGGVFLPGAAYGGGEDVRYSITGGVSLYL